MAYSEVMAKYKEMQTKLMGMESIYSATKTQLHDIFYLIFLITSTRGYKNQEME